MVPELSGSHAFLYFWSVSATMTHRRGRIFIQCFELQGRCCFDSARAVLRIIPVFRGCHTKRLKKSKVHVQFRKNTRDDITLNKTVKELVVFI